MFRAKKAYEIRMAPVKHIGIAGCGIGGLAAAGFLARLGHRVKVFDQFDAPAPVGSGLVIQPVGQAALHALGVGDYARSLGTRINAMVGVEADSGKKVLNVSYGGADSPRFGLAIHRASLFEAVLRSARTAGAEIVPGARITGSTVQNNKRFLQIEGGESAAPFDLVIDASGTGSPLSPMQAKPLPYGALWGVVDVPAETTLQPDLLAQCYRKSSSMVGVLPIGILPGDSSRKSAVFWSLPSDEYEAWQARPIEEWAAQATKLWPDFAPYAAQITRHDDLTMARYTHGNLRNPVAERLAFIGDAAHRSSPQLGQGANMALIDAFLLADALGRLDIDEALQEYARVRRWHVRVYQMVSWAFTPMYQSDSRVLPLLRDWLLTPVSYVPPVPWLLRRLVCGEFVSPGELITRAMAEMDS